MSEITALNLKYLVFSFALYKSISELFELLKFMNFSLGVNNTFIVHWTLKIFAN